MKRLRPFLVLVLLVLLTGCDRETVREKRERLCTQLETMNTAISTLRSIGPAASDMKEAKVQMVGAVRDFKRAKTQMVDSLNATQSPTEEIPEATIEDLEVVSEELDQAVEDIPEQLSITEAMTLISDKITTAESTVARLNSRLRCPD